MRMETIECVNAVVLENDPGVVQAPSEKRTYSVAEAASVLGVSKPSIYRLIARRVLNPVPGLRSKRIPMKQVRRLADGLIEMSSRD
jgi:excisionase family DNA binding protein